MYISDPIYDAKTGYLDFSRPKKRLLIPTTSIWTGVLTSTHETRNAWLLVKSRLKSVWKRLFIKNKEKSDEIKPITVAYMINWILCLETLPFLATLFWFLGFVTVPIREIEFIIFLGSAIKAINDEYP